MTHHQEKQVQEPRLVSIVMPVYNRAASISASIDSVREQTYAKWEVIVVDDGSRDGTQDVVRRMAADEPRIRLIQHERNQGAPAARNTGWRAARGEWIIFLDSDDQLLPDCLQRRLDAAERCGYRVVDSAGYWWRFGAAAPEIYEKYMPGPGRVYKQLLTRQGPTSQSLLIARTALEEIGGLDETVIRFQEWDTAIRLAKHYPFGVLNEPTFLYDCRGMDAMTKNRKTTGIGYQQIMHRHFWAMLWNGGPGLIAAHYRFVADHCYRPAGQEVAFWRCRTLHVLWSILAPRGHVRKLRRLFSGR